MAAWYACQEPEREPDEDTLWHLHCGPCRIKVKAHLANAATPKERYLRSLTAALCQVPAEELEAVYVDPDTMLES